MKINYNEIYKDIIKGLTFKPTILLHSCCGPCSTQVINELVDYFDITVLYYNPNIEPEEEYLKRKAEQKRFLKEFPNQKITCMDIDYDNETFKVITKGLEQEAEGGKRCAKCLELRLQKTAQKAKENNFTYFGTTLTVSPHKNSELINEIGKKLQEKYKISYLFSDFKKENGYLKSIEYAKKYNLYRQNYCGCQSSKNFESR